MKKPIIISLLFSLILTVNACDTSDDNLHDIDIDEEEVIDSNIGTFTGTGSFKQYYLSTGDLEIEYKDEYCSVKIEEYYYNKNYYLVKIDVNGKIGTVITIVKSTKTLIDDEFTGSIGLSSSSCSGSINNLTAYYSWSCKK